jgi:NADH-quinone oxidoreductase subunit N
MLNVTMFFAALPKIIMFSILIKLFFSSLFDFHVILKTLLLFASLLSITIGTFSAIYQKRIKRLFAYSAIAHTGFILLGFISNSAESSKATIAYILIYALMTILLFSLLILASISTNNNPKYLANWTSFGSKNYLFAISFTLILFSIAGIPPLAGFFSKFFVLLTAVSNGYYFSSFYIIFISSIACFYYIRLIKMFFFTKFSKNSFWLANSAKKNTDGILALLMFFNLAFFLKPEFVSHFATVIAFSVV